VILLRKGACEYHHGTCNDKRNQEALLLDAIDYDSATISSLRAREMDEYSSDKVMG